jgi:hypothetical protein
MHFFKEFKSRSFILHYCVSKLACTNPGHVQKVEHATQLRPKTRNCRRACAERCTRTNKRRSEGQRQHDGIHIDVMVKEEHTTSVNTTTNQREERERESIGKKTPDNRGSERGNSNPSGTSPRYLVK